MLRKICLFAFLLSVTSPLVAEELGPDTWNIRLTGPGSGVQKTEGGIALLYRPHLQSKVPWYEDTHVSLEAKPSEAVKADDGKTYGDMLCVVIRSTGKIRDKRSFEALDGVVARIDFVTGDLYLQITKDGETFTNLATAKGAKPLSADDWHKISISDVKGTITLAVGEATVTTKTEPLDGGYSGVWGVYNREPVGPGPKILQIRGVNYTTPPR